MGVFRGKALEVLKQILGWQGFVGVLEGKTSGFWKPLCGLFLEGWTLFGKLRQVLTRVATKPA